MEDSMEKENTFQKLDNTERAFGKTVSVQDGLMKMIQQTIHDLHMQCNFISNKTNILNYFALLQKFHLNFI